MVLSGTLKEFILADVFNLLMQQRITGKLILTENKNEGTIVFKDGIIVGAECGDENLTNKLFNYMVDVKKKAPEQLTPLFSSNAENLSALCSAITERDLIGKRELKSFADLCVEDISCGLLAWSKGTYRFNSFRGVAAQACGMATIPVENVIMEGMRRTDEWSRMQEYIKEDMIFVPAAKNQAASGEINVTAAPEEYIFGLLDGSNTVKALTKNSCLCEYKVYESINTLLQSQRITALHQKYTQSIQAALKRKDAEEASILSKTFSGSLVSIAAAAVVAAFFTICGLFLLPAFGLGKPVDKSAYVPDAVESARLLHRATSGEDAGDAATLKSAGLLTDKDF